MKNKLIKAILTTTLMMNPEILSNYSAEYNQNHLSKQGNFRETKEYFSTINQKIELKEKALDFIEKRKNYTNCSRERKDIYNKRFQEYSNEIKTLKHKRDSLYKIIYSE